MDFTIEDNQLLATLILEVDDLEIAIDDLTNAIELVSTYTINEENKKIFNNLFFTKMHYLEARDTYLKKLKELEDRAYKNNYNPY